MTDIKPTALKRGMPGEQSNGLLGIEEDLIERPEGDQIIAIVTLTVDEVMEKRHAGEVWPVVAIKHIEPLHVDADIKKAIALRDQAYKKRTGANTLPGIDGEDD